MSNCFNYKNATGSTRKPGDLANISTTFCLQGVAKDCNVTESTNYVQYFKNTLAPTYNKVGYKYIKCFKTLKKESPFTNDRAITHTCHFGREDTVDKNGENHTTKTDCPVSPWSLTSASSKHPAIILCLSCQLPPMQHRDGCKASFTLPAT